MDKELDTLKDKYKMIQHFEKRTKEHVNRVQRNAKKLAELHPDIANDLLQQVENHDQSKFEEPEYTPYLYVNWKYKLQYDGKEFDVPKKIEDAMNAATEHHINHNKHHPEYWEEGDSKINPDNRDALPEKMIDGTKMDDASLAEMVADWHSISQERGGVTKEWADKNVNKRWEFTDDQKDKIYQYVDDLEDVK